METYIMKNKIFAAIAALMMLSMGTASAQYDETNSLFYHTFRTPQSTLLNPAFHPNRNTFYISLPALDFRFHSPMSLGEFIHPGTDANGHTITVIDLDSLFDGLANDNHFRLSPRVEIFGMGVKIHNTFVNLNVRMVNDINLGMPVSAINALRSGNLQEDGTPITELNILDGDILSMQSYLEAGIGAGHYFAPIHLGVGVRAKLLYGLVNARTTNTRVVLNTDQDLNAISADIYYQAQVAAAVPMDTNFKFVMPGAITDLLSLENANKGFAFDLGAYYDFGPLKISASVLDLSPGINWKYNTYDIVPTGGNAHVEFNGMNMNSMLGVDESGDTMSIGGFVSDLRTNMKPVLSETDTLDFWCSIPTKINIGASYSFLSVFRAGLLFHGQFDRGLISNSQAVPVSIGDGINAVNDVFNNAREAKFRYNTTLSFGVNLGNWIELIAATSVVYDGTNTNWFNPGFGGIFTPFSTLQFYAMADYMSNFYIIDCKQFNLKFGMNLLFGNGGRGRNYDY